MTNSDAMDRRVILQSKVVTRDAVGGPIETWSDVVTDTSDHGVWASVRDLRAKETMAAEMAGSAVSRIVGIRWRAGVTAAMRIKFADDVIGRIAAVTELGRKEKLELQVEITDG